MSAKASNTPYVAAVVVMFTVAVASITAIAMTRPGQDNAALYVLISGLIPTATAAVLAFMKAQETHLAVNSRLDEFIANAGSAARAEGELHGREQGRTEANKRSDDLRKGRT